MRTPDYESPGVKLYLGDCLDVLPELSGVDAVVTDPPYGVGLTKKTNDFRDSRVFVAGESTMVESKYEDSPEHVEALIAAFMPLALGRCKRALVFPGTRMLFAYPKPDSVGCVFVPNGAGSDKWGFGCFNPILYYGKCPYTASGKGRRPNAFSDTQPNREKIDHPCPKPIKWMEWSVNRASLPGETVLDCFAGSGTTGLACLRLGRSFVGIEKQEAYFDIAVRRIEAELARQPLLAGGAA